MARRPVTLPANSWHSDDDNQDGVPDYADGFPVPGVTDDPPTAENGFTPVVLDLSASMLGGDPTVTFQYSGSDPAALTAATDVDGVTTYTPADGDLRLWTLRGNQQRDPLADYVAPGQPYDLNTLRADGLAEVFAIDPGVAAGPSLGLLFWAEGVHHSDAAGGDPIAVTVGGDDVGTPIDPGPISLNGIGGPTTANSDRVDGSIEQFVAVDGQAFQPTYDPNQQAPAFGDKVGSDTHLTALQATNGVAGAITDGTSVVAMKYVPAIPGASYTLYEHTAAAEGDPYVVGSLWSWPTNGSLPQLPAGDRLTDHEVGQRADQAVANADPVLYRPPDNFLLDASLSNDGQNQQEADFIDVRVSGFGAGGAGVLGHMFLLRRPPLVLVHGFMGSANTFDPATWKSESAPYDTLMYRVDYSATGMDGLAENFHYVPDMIATAVGQYRSGTDPTNNPLLVGKHFAATRVDVVAHSMGGLLVKWYAADFTSEIQTNGTATISRGPTFGTYSLARTSAYQYLQGNNFGAGTIHRFISVDSPFQGTPLATVAATKIGYVANPAFATVVNNSDVAVKSVFLDSTGALKPTNAVFDLSDGTGGANPTLNALAAATFPTSFRAVQWEPIAGLALHDPAASVTLASFANTVLFGAMNRVLLNGLGLTTKQLLQPATSSDLIVPLESQLNGDDDFQRPFNVFVGYAHTSIPGYNSVTSNPDVAATITADLTDEPTSSSFAPLSP